MKIRGLTYVVKSRSARGNFMFFAVFYAERHHEVLVQSFRFFKIIDNQCLANPKSNPTNQESLQKSPSKLMKIIRGKSKSPAPQREGLFLVCGCVLHVFVFSALISGFNGPEAKPPKNHREVMPRSWRPSMSWNWRLKLRQNAKKNIGKHRKLLTKLLLLLPLPLLLPFRGGGAKWQSFVRRFLLLFRSRFLDNRVFMGFLRLLQVFFFF